MVGAGLASIGLALGGGLGRVAIPATDGALTLAPCGTSPVLDPLFSTERVEVEYDASGLGRVGKVLALAEERPELLPYLKVCFEENRPDNCGRCGKCLLTMSALRLAGALEWATGFPEELDLDLVRTAEVQNVGPLLEWGELMRAPGAGEELRAAVGEAIRRSARALRTHDPLRERRATPDFRARHTNAVISLLRSGRPHPPPGAGSAGPPVVGLLRAVDRDAGRHVYAAGRLPGGELAGELGALLADPAEHSVPLWIESSGKVCTSLYRPDPVRPGRATMLRWALAPLRWRELGPLGGRAAASARRVLTARNGRSADQVPATGSPGEPAGFLRAHGGAGTLPLYSAVHPVTGDQLLTTSEWEANDMGYMPRVLLGFLVAEAPVTGRLGTGRLLLPWASRYGQLVRE
jgi:hypothetical protein